MNTQKEIGFKLTVIPHIYILGLGLRLLKSPCHIVVHIPC